mgnify:CR=1 FL=1|jgi:hypothetical protein
MNLRNQKLDKLKDHDRLDKAVNPSHEREKIEEQILEDKILVPKRDVVLYINNFNPKHTGISLK